MSTQAAAVLAADGAGAQGARRGRTLWEYLLLPRPKDMIKCWILPLAFGVGTLAVPDVSGAQLVRAAVLWAALELLIYQARYQWNDIRGFAADQRHPDVASRGRLPGPVERGPEHIRASRMVMAARLAAALALGAVTGQLVVVVALIVAVFGVAAAYEHLRGRATGRATGMPVALAPPIVGLWLVVGGGYAIRGVTGLGLAVELPERAGLAAAAIATLWSYGVAFVTVRWGLEALAFARCRDGRLVWSVQADQAREHTLALARWLPPVGAATDVSRWAALRGSTPLDAPWNLAVVAAGACAAVTGLLLVDRPDVGGAALAAGAGGGLALVLVVRAGRGVGAWVGAVLLAAGHAAAGTPEPALAALPWCLVAVAHALFAHQSPHTLGRPVRSLLRTG